MIKEIVATGKDIIEAKENARAALGASPLDDVKFEVLHAGSKGFMGFFTKPAQVKAYIEIAERENKRHRPERKKDKANNSKPQANENAPEEKAAAQTGKDTQSNTQKNKNKKDKRQERAQNKTERVIPEAELNMQLKTVEAGDDLSFDFINTLIADIGLDASAELYSCEDGTRRIKIVGNDASLLIGHHGDTLDALQYLANLASSRKNSKGEKEKSRVTIDIQGYRAKREETLRALARRKAATALRNKRSVMLEPMSAYERRIIHSEIQGIEGVSTSSIGSDNNRKVVIYLTDKKPKEIFEEKAATKTPLEEEFKLNEDEILASSSVGAVDQVATAFDLDEEDSKNEAIAIENTVPDESDDIVVSIDDSDIK